MTDARARRFEAAAIAAGLVALVVWSAWQRYAFLASSPYPLGVDGYYYPIQLRSVLAHGTLHYPASPLAFWLMAPLAALTDPITGAKLGAAIGGALIALPAYAVGARLGGGRLAGLVAATLATTSAGSWYLSVEFVKNGWGLTAALTAVWLILRAIDSPRLSRILIAAAGLIAAALTHKMALALVAAIGGPAIVVAIFVGRDRIPRARLVCVSVGAGALVAAATLLAIVFPQRFISPSDLALLGDVFTSIPRWDAPALSMDHGRFELLMDHEARDAGILALVAIALLVGARYQAWRDPERSAPSTAAAIAVTVLAVFVALPWLDVGDPQGLGFRLRIVAFVPLALVAAIVVGHVTAFVAPALARGRWLGLAIAATVAIGPIVVAPAERTEGVVRVHPPMAAAGMALAGAVPTGDTIVVSERHILFMAAYYTGNDVVLRPEPIAPSRRWRLMPRAFIGVDTSLYRLLLSARAAPGLDPPRGFHPRDPNGLVVVPEATWSWILERLPPVPRRHYREWHTI